MSDRPSDCTSPWSHRNKLPVDPLSSGEALGYQAAVNPASWKMGGRLYLLSRYRPKRLSSSLAAESHQ